MKSLLAGRQGFLSSLAFLCELLELRLQRCKLFLELGASFIFSIRHDIHLTAPYSLGSLGLSTKRADPAGSSPALASSSLLSISAD